MLNKAKTLIAAMAAGAILLSAPALTGCKPEAPVERTDVEREEDGELAEQVKAALGNSSSFKFPDVQVTSFNGNVQLSGFALTADQKRSAETIAKGVPGVVSVENKISLKR